VTVLDGHRLEAAGIATVVDALRTVPGLTVVQAGAYGSVASVFMRGGESDYVEVLIDGVQVNEPGGRFDFAHLTLQQIDRIEIVRGPASAMYGSDAVSGVIQILTRTGSGTPAGGAELTGGTYGSWRGAAHVEGGGDAVSYGVAAARTHSGGVLPVNNDYENLTLSGRVAMTSDARTDLRLSAHYSDHTFHYPTDGTGSIVDANAFDFGDDLTLGLDARRRLGGAAELRLSLGLRDSESGTEDLPDGPADSLGFFEYRSLDDVRRASADLRARFALGGAGSVTTGVQLEGQRLRSVSASDSEFGPSSGASEESRTNRAWYAQWIVRGGALAASGSVRLEDNEAFGGFVTYSLGLAYWLERTGTKLRATIGRGMKDPTLVESYATGFAVGNPDLAPETSMSREVGVDQLLLAGALRLSVTGFDQSFRDLIQYTFSPPAPDGPNFFNVGRAEARGVEAEAVARFGPLDLSAGYTWLYTGVTDAGFDEGEDATFVEGERLLRRPAHELTASVIGRVLDRGTAGVTLRRVGSRTDRDFSAFPAARVELAPYTTLDVHGEIRVWGGPGAGPRLSLVGRVENLFDTSYAEIQGFPARGRTIRVGGRAAILP